LEGNNEETFANRRRNGVRAGVDRYLASQTKCPADHNDRGGLARRFNNNQPHNSNETSAASDATGDISGAAAF
jgi:hypothetical protein